MIFDLLGTIATPFYILAIAWAAGKLAQILSAAGYILGRIAWEVKTR